MLLSEFINNKEGLYFKIPESKTNFDFILDLEKFSKKLNKKILVVHDEFNGEYTIYNDKFEPFSKSKKIRLIELNFKEIGNAN